MPSVSYSDFHNVMNLTTGEISAIRTENLLDWAIDLINLFANQSISNMNGVNSPGSKTVTLTSAQRGAVFLVARALYYEYRLNVIEGPGLRPVDPLGNSTVMASIQLAAKRLQPKKFERV